MPDNADFNGPASFTQRVDDEPGCLVQALWFVFIGWWAGAFVATVAWFFNVTIIGLPVGMALLNNIPKVLALQSPRKYIQVYSDGEHTHVEQQRPKQRSFLLRALYFIFIGWWWSAIWMSLAYTACGTLLLLPVGLAMFRRVPEMTTLARY